MENSTLMFHLVAGHHPPVWVVGTLGDLVRVRRNKEEKKLKDTDLEGS